MLNYIHLDRDGEGSRLNRTFQLVMHNMLGGLPMWKFKSTYNWTSQEVLFGYVSSTYVKGITYPISRENKIGLRSIAVRKLLNQ